MLERIGHFAELRTPIAEVVDRGYVEPRFFINIYERLAKDMVAKMPDVKRFRHVGATELQEHFLFFAEIACTEVFLVL